MSDHDEDVERITGYINKIEAYVKEHGPFPETDDDLIESLRAKLKILERNLKPAKTPVTDKLMDIISERCNALVDYKALASIRSKP